MGCQPLKIELLYIGICWGCGPECARFFGLVGGSGELRYSSLFQSGVLNNHSCCIRSCCHEYGDYDDNVSASSRSCFRDPFARCSAYAHVRP